MRISKSFLVLACSPAFLPFGLLHLHELILVSALSNDVGGLRNPFLQPASIRFRNVRRIVPPKKTFGVGVSNLVSNFILA